MKAHYSSHEPLECSTSSTTAAASLWTARRSFLGIARRSALVSDSYSFVRLTWYGYHLCFVESFTVSFQSSSFVAESGIKCFGADCKSLPVQGLWGAPWTGSSCHLGSAHCLGSEVLLGFHQAADITAAVIGALIKVTKVTEAVFTKEFLSTCVSCYLQYRIHDYLSECTCRPSQLSWCLCPSCGHRDWWDTGRCASSETDWALVVGRLVGVSTQLLVTSPVPADS